MRTESIVLPPSWYNNWHSGLVLLPEVVGSIFTRSKEKKTFFCTKAIGLGVYQVYICINTRFTDPANLTDLDFEMKYEKNDYLAS